MLKNKAQIARESIKTILYLELPCRALNRGPGPLPKVSFGSALVMCVRAHNLLRAPPPPPLNENPGSAPDWQAIDLEAINFVLCTRTCMLDIAAT